MEPADRDLLSEVPIGGAGTLGGHKFTRVWIAELSVKDLTTLMQRKMARYPFPPR